MIDKPLTEEIVWRPSEEAQRRTRLFAFMEQHHIPDYPALLARASADPAWFWAAAVEDIAWSWNTPYQQVLDLADGPEWPHWFVGGRTNLTLNAVDKHATGPLSSRVALRWEGDEGALRSLTYTELERAVTACAGALARLGIGEGDVVGLFLPMIPEAAITLLATAKLGAIVTPFFSGYGPDAISARLNDSGAKVLVTADGFWRRGSIVKMKETADAAIAASPTVIHQLVVRRLGRTDTPWQAGRDVWWHEACAAAPSNIPTRDIAAEAPFLLIYTSGTTGRPKGTVHVHSGFPIKAAQDMAHGFDVRESDTIFWFTDMGWMMGPWLVYGGLTLGATIVMFEGTPDWPDAGRIWEVAARHGATILGISPTVVRVLMAQGEEWPRRYDLSKLRVLGSSGEPWNPGPWRWFFEQIGGGRCPIINYSGGTEVSGGIVSGNLITPIKPVAFAGPVPGMAAEVVDDECRSVREQVGELIIRHPCVGMTKGFWNDAERYHNTYWARWPGVWWHGDFAYIDEDGFWYILGRSDDTIKIAGKRLGPAEVESQLVRHPAIAEAAAVGVPDETKGEALVCFVVLRPGHQPSLELDQELSRLIQQGVGKALKPKAIHVVSALPKTRNGKVLRRVARAVYSGGNPGDLSALENPAAVEEIAALYHG